MPGRPEQSILFGPTRRISLPMLCAYLRLELVLARSKITNDYRPLSIICHIAKIVERFVKAQLLDFLTAHNFISSDQSAYLKGHSTITCLHRVIDHWLETINVNEFTAISMVDVTKCFDSINHELLLKKLDKYGIRGRENAWFRSYLKDRQQAVYCNSQLSSFLINHFGVPQGSILGPLLFLIFVNDIVNCSVAPDSMTNLFADDMLNSASGNTPAEAKIKVEYNIIKLGEWYEKNRLALHPTKTKFMFIGSRDQIRINLDPLPFYFKGNFVDKCDDAKYLGLIMEPNLSWNKQVANVVRKLNHQASILKNLSSVCSTNLLLTYYRAFIQPRIDYGITLWGCTSLYNINKVQRVQNRIARRILNNYDYENARGLELLKQLKIPNITERRDYFLTKITFQSIHGLNPTYLNDAVLTRSDMHGRSTRSADDIHLPRIGSEMYRNSLSIKGGQLFNDLPNYVKKSADIDDFKSNYYKMLFE